MVGWEVVEAPNGRYNRLAAERLASSILIEAIERALATTEIVAGIRGFEGLPWSSR